MSPENPTKGCMQYLKHVFFLLFLKKIKLFFNAKSKHVDKLAAFLHFGNLRHFLTWKSH